jgi:hypothetical protein
MRSQIIALADTFNKKITIEIRGVKFELNEGESSRLIMEIYDARHKIELENIP